VKESLTAEPGALAVIGARRRRQLTRRTFPARTGAGLLRRDHRRRAGARVARRRSEEILEELTGAIEARSAEGILTLVHRDARGRTKPAAFLPRSHRPFSQPAGGPLCGAESDLIAAPADRRPRLKQAAASFTEEDLTRFFQILLHTEDDLRRKPDARLHLEMGLLRMVNAARLAPLEEILAEL